jgi:hypothetical protein
MAIRRVLTLKPHPHAAAAKRQPRGAGGQGKQGRTTRGERRTEQRQKQRDLHAPIGERSRSLPNRVKEVHILGEGEYSGPSSYVYNGTRWEGKKSHLEETNSTLEELLAQGLKVLHWDGVYVALYS